MHSNPFPTTVDVANVIGKFKAGVTRTVGNALMHSEKQDIWQKSYRDHIIRNEKEYLSIKSDCEEMRKMMSSTTKIMNSTLNTPHSTLKKSTKGSNEE